MVEPRPKPSFSHTHPLKSRKTLPITGLYQYPHSYFLCQTPNTPLRPQQRRGKPSPPPWTNTFSLKPRLPTP